MEDNSDFQNILLHFLKGEKELINNLNIFYLKNKKEFIKYISDQDIENLLYGKIKEYNLDTKNIFFYKRIEEIKYNLEKENVSKVKVALEFLTFFQKNNIKILPYKGFVYSYLAYGDFYSRKMADFDFLLEKPKDIYKIFDLIKDNETFVIEYGKRLDKDRLYWEIKSNQEITIIYKNVIFEVHQEIKSQFYFFPRANYPWWNDFKTEELTVENRKIDVTKKEIFLLEIICHNINHEWSPISLPFDMSYLLKNNKFNWELIKAEAKKLGITTILNEGLLYTYKMTGVEPYPNFSKLVQSGLISNVVAKMEKKNLYKRISPGAKMSLKLFLGRFFLAIREKETLSDKFFMILDYAFSPTKRNYEILKLPRYLYFLYYIFNPIFMLFNRIRSAT